MAAGPIHGATRQVERLFNAGTVAGLSEQQLLDRFVARRDEAAFEAIVARHGPMVLGVCRRWLRDPNDVDDAFQATFLVLARKAGSLHRRELLANWLYGVASRVALRARAVAARQAAREGESVNERPAVEAPAIETELHQRLHQEIGRLPEKYRAPVVLCYLEGLTHDEAAERLGWPPGSVKGRLARARGLLRARLTRRGITSAGVVALMAGLPAAVSAAVPASLFDATVRMILAPAAHPLAGPVLTLAEGVVHAMLITKLKLAGLVLLVAVGAVGAGAAVRAYQGPDQPAAASPAASKAEQKPAAPDAAKQEVRKPREVPDPFDATEMLGPDATHKGTPKPRRTRPGTTGNMTGGGGYAGDQPSKAQTWTRIRIQAAVRHEIALLSKQALDRTPKEKAILEKLDGPISMSFARETPFEDVLRYIKSATQGPNDSGIPIYVDPEGLALAEKTMQSPVAINLEGVPLKTTLRLVLRQIGLAYCVKDGILMISTPEIIVEELKEIGSKDLDWGELESEVTHLRRWLYGEHMELPPRKGAPNDN